jgi:hypothetical protein
MTEPLRVEDYISPRALHLAWEDVGFEAESLPSVQSQLEAAARKVAEAEQGAAQVAAGARSLVEESRAKPPDNLEEVISLLEKLESESSARRATSLSSLSRARKVFAESRNTRFRLKALTLLERLELSRVSWLEALRDARWELMALRSELNRGDEQRVGFDGSRSLQELLGSLKP